MTIRGAINRYRRKHGKGQRLFTVTDRRIRYTGVDKFDEHLYAHYMTAYFPHRFVFGKIEPDYRDEIINAWLHRHCKGEFDFWFEPMYGEGMVMLSDQDDAVFFRLTFSNIHKVPYENSLTMEAAHHELVRNGLA